MSVNGTGLDRKTKKPLNDQTSWTVKTPNGVILTDQKGKELTGLNASDASTAVMTYRRKRVWAVAVRA